MNLERLISRRWTRRPAAILVRHILVACLITLCVGVLLLAVARATGWKQHNALKSDTRSVAAQAGEQLMRSLVSRRGTLTFIRDTLNRQADLSVSQLRAIGASATEHTRHLLGIGLIRAQTRPSWWFGPSDLSEAETKELYVILQQKLKLRGIWRVPSTFTVEVSDDRMLLGMLEPLSASVFPNTAIIGIFEVRPLLRDFFSSGLAQRHPVRVLEGSNVLYKSDDWGAKTQEHPQSIVAQAPINIDAVRWTVHVQPGSSRLIQALSLATIVVVALSVLAGVGIIGIAWILVARTWILEQAVIRRTAALRRTLVRLRQLATTDELTGLYNRRFFFSRWASEYDRAKRYGRPLACLLIDVNNFKQVNDRLGHLAGDRLLQRVAQALKGQFRQSDILARIGGDEFIVALAETDLLQAERVTEKLRKLAIPVVENAASLPAIRLSVGLAWNGNASDSAQDIIQTADNRLYEDKKRSRSEALSEPGRSSVLAASTSARIRSEKIDHSSS